MARVTHLPAGGVVLSISQALLLVDTLSRIQKNAIRQGSSLKSPVVQLVADIHAAIGSTADQSPPDSDTYDYELIDATTTAEILGCQPRNVRDLATRGRLPGQKISGRWHFHREDVEAFKDFR